MKCDNVDTLFSKTSLSVIMWKDTLNELEFNLLCISQNKRNECYNLTQLVFTKKVFNRSVNM